MLSAPLTVVSLVSPLFGGSLSTPKAWCPSGLSGLGSPAALVPQWPPSILPAPPAGDFVVRVDMLCAVALPLSTQSFCQDASCPQSPSHTFLTFVSSWILPPPLRSVNQLCAPLPRSLPTAPVVPQAVVAKHFVAVSSARSFPTASTTAPTTAGRGWGRRCESMSPLGGRRCCRHG